MRIYELSHFAYIALSFAFLEIARNYSANIFRMKIAALQFETFTLSLKFKSTLEFAKKGNVFNFSSGRNEKFSPKFSRTRHFPLKHTRTIVSDSNSNNKFFFIAAFQTSNHLFIFIVIHDIICRLRACRLIQFAKQHLNF